MTKLPNALDHRTADHDIETLFVARWSPRAMSGDKLDQSQLDRLLEAARWAPSTYNVQEWRFLYAHRDTPHFDAFLNVLAEPNQQWAKKAAVLGVVCSRTRFEKNDEPNPVNIFDSGLAFMNLALQGTAMGLVVHGMAGFDKDAVHERLEVPRDLYNVNAMFAVGQPGDPDELPEDFRNMEQPSGRNPISAFSCEGPFNFE